MQTQATPTLNLGGAGTQAPLFQPSAGTTTTPQTLNFGGATTGGTQPGISQPTLNLAGGQPAGGQGATGTQQNPVSQTFTINTSSNQQPVAGSQPTGTTLPAQSAPAAPQKPISMKSFRFIVGKIQPHLQSLNYKGVDYLIRAESGTDTIKNLQNALLYFKPQAQAEQSSRKKLFDAQNPLKWGGKDLLSTRLANELVIKLSDTLNLDEQLTFDLLESFFLTNENTRKLLVYILTIDMNITNAELSIPQQSNMLQNMQLIQRGLKNIDTWKSEFANVVLQAYNEAQIVYFQERAALLQCILAILSNPGTKDRSASPLIKDLLADGKLEDNLLKSLLRNKASMETFTQMTCSVREIIVALQREEILILSCLIKIYAHYQTPKTSQIIDFLKYQTETRFRGLRLRPHDFQSDVTVNLQTQKITSLAIQQFFNYLQLQEFTSNATIKGGSSQLTANERLKKFVVSLFSKTQEFKELVNLIESLKQPLDDIDAVIYLTFRQICEAIVNLDLLQVFGQQDKRNLLQFDRNIRNEDLKRSNLMEFMIFIRQGEEQFEQEPSTAVILYVAGSSQKEDLQVLVQDWINLVYPFFKAYSMEESIAIAQDITFNVISQPNQLKYVWSQILQTSNGQSILGSRGGLGHPPAQRKIIYSTIDIFENILERPFDPENQDKFFILVRTLCGNKMNPYALEVVNLLQSTPLNRIPMPRDFNGGDWSVLQYLVKLVIDWTSLLENDMLSTKNQQDYLQLVELFGKILSQNYLSYPEINSEAIALIMDLDQLEDNILVERPSLKYGGDLRKNDPILNQIFQAFYIIIQKLPLDQATDSLTQIIKALTTIYKNLDLQSIILQQISECKNFQGIPVLLEFFIFNLEQNESQSQLSYKLSRAFLSFTNAIFKQDSIVYQENSYRANLAESLPARFLTQLYQTIYQNFVKLQFKEMKDFLKVYIQLLKTTKTLIKKYRDIPAPYKIGNCHRYPQYDEWLRLVTDCLNSENLEFLVINSLMLSEQVVKSHSTGITNKYWSEQLQSSSIGSAESGTTRQDDSTGKMRLLVQKLIKEGLQCINLILDLSYTCILSQSSGALIGSKHFYQRKLKCVENLTSLVRYPGQWELYPIQTATSTVSYSLFNIVQYYVKPHLHLCPFMTQVQIEAVKFFQLCARIWETQPIGERVSLESTQRTTNISSQDIRQKYVANFKSSCKQLGLTTLSMHYLITFLDLLITCTSTQSQFVSDIFKEQEFVNVFIEDLIKKNIRQKLLQAYGQREINPGVSALVSIIESKVVILLSEMSNNKVSESFMRKINEADDLMRVFEHYIKPMLTQIQQIPNFDYQGEIAQNQLFKQGIQVSNNSRILKVNETSQALISIKYFLRLLQNEFQRDPNSENIKKVIRLLCENPQFIQGAFKTKISLNEQHERLLKINIVMSSFERNARQWLRELCQNVESKQGRLSQEQIDMLNHVDNKLVTGEDCAVYLNQQQVDLNRVHAWIVKAQTLKPLHLIQSNATDPLDFEDQFGILGPEFVVNFEELTSLALTYFYDDAQLIAEMRSASASFNLAVSHFYAYEVFVGGVSEFIVQIGKTRMRENMRSRELVMDNRALCTSLFNLVVSDNITDVVRNAGALSGTQNRLAKLLIDFAKPLSRKLQIPPQSLESTTILEVSLTELELDFLSVILGSLNATGEIGLYSKDILKALESEVITPMIKGLPKLRQQILLPTREAGSLSQVESADRNANKMFINLVLQIFSLSQQLEVKPDAMMASQAQQISELDYIQIMSQVVKIMQEATYISGAGATSTQVSTYFIEGLKIIETGFNLLTNENIILFMHKQETSPLKVILNKFLQTSSTVEEKIKIVEFLTSYARIDQGAEHLMKENVLKNLGISQLMALVNQIDFYLIELGQTEAKRNPLHILWCHLLLFMRTLNHILMSNSPDYRRTIPLQINLQWTRMQALLEFGMHLKEQKFDHKAISLALYEEIELITGIVQQYFDYTDELYQQDYEHYVEIKDRLLFGLLHLFVQDFPSTANSATEQFLNGMTHDRLAPGVLRPGKYTGLDLTIDGLKIRIYFNTISALLNASLINQNKASREDFINTWDPLPKLGGMDSKQISRQGAGATPSYIQSQFYNPAAGANDYEQFRSLTQLSSAVANLNAAQQNLSQIFRIWSGSADQPIGQLFNQVQKVLMNDEWINNEYMGINTYFAGLSYADIVDQFEQALSMSYLVSGMFLAKLKQSYDAADQAGYLQYQSTVSMKQLIDLGEQIVKDYRQFEGEIRRNASVPNAPAGAPERIARVIEQGKTLEGFIDRLRLSGPYYGGGGTSTIRAGDYDYSKSQTPFSRYR